MKVHIQIDLPDNTTAQEVQSLFREFTWLARLRGWRTLFALPKLRKTLKKPELARG